MTRTRLEFSSLPHLPLNSRRMGRTLPGVLLRFGAAGGATAAYNPGPVPIRKGHWKTGPGENASGSRN